MKNKGLARSEQVVNIKRPSPFVYATVSTIKIKARCRDGKIIDLGSNMVGDHVGS